MNDTQKQKAIALGKCTFPVGSGQKRFAHSMLYLAKEHPDKEITEKQAAYLDLLFHQYRRQIPKSHKRLCSCPEAVEKRAQLTLAPAPGGEETR